MISTIHKRFSCWFKQNTSLKAWLWFIVLWMIGLTATLTLTYPIKIFFRLLK
jgi:hypothetical protein